MEYRRFPLGEVSPVSTFEFHEHRERAPHLEQWHHRERLLMARDMVVQYAATQRARTQVVDLGCGDGGLLQLLQPFEHQDPQIVATGYDFQPSNEDGWAERHVDALPLNFVEQWHTVDYADLYVLTEVLEHLDDPYNMLLNICGRGAAIVCSSPWTEHEGSIDGCHAWAWDMPGYIAMLEACGFTVIRSERVTWSQVHLAVPNEA